MAAGSAILGVCRDDNDLKEIFVKFNVGGFQQQKAVYVLQPN